VTELKLTDTIGQMRDKINEIINTKVTEIKLYNSDGDDFVSIIYENNKVTITHGDSTTDIADFSST